MSMESRPMSRRSTLDAREGALLPPYISTVNLQQQTASLPPPTAGSSSSALPSRTPSLPLVVIKAQKPSSIQEIRDQALVKTHEAATDTGTRRRPSTSSENHPPMRTQEEDIAPSIASSMAVLAASSVPPTSHDTMLSSTSSSMSSSSAAVAAAIQTRTIHPQVHYVFADDDPHASTLLTQLPKNRVISLHLDPATGQISGVDSFIPEFQITRIQAVPVPVSGGPPTTTTTAPIAPSLGLQTSGSSSSLSAGVVPTTTTATATPPSPAAAPTTPLHGPPPSLLSSSSSHHNMTNSTILGQKKAARGQLPTHSGSSNTITTMASTGSSSSSSISSTGVNSGGGPSAMSRQASLKETSSTTDVSGTPLVGPPATPSQPVYRDWTLVIEGVETDPHPERGRPGYYYDAASKNELHFLEDSTLMAASATSRGGEMATKGSGAVGATGSNSADHLPMTLTTPAAIGFHTEPDPETQQTNLVLNDDYLDDCEAILASFGARNKLLKKVLDFNTNQPLSAPAGPSAATVGVPNTKLGANDNADQNVP